MATVTSVGGTKGIDESGLVDLLRTGMLTRQQNQDRQADLQYKTQDLQLRQEQLKADKENMKSMRQSAAWQSLTEKATMAAQRQGLQWGTPEYDKFIKQQLAMGVGSPDGKINTDNVRDMFGDAAADYFTALDVGGKGNPGAPADAIGTKTGDALANAKANAASGGNPWGMAELGGAGGLGALLNAMKGNPVGQLIAKGWTAANSPLGKGAAGAAEETGLGAESGMAAAPELLALLAPTALGLGIGGQINNWASRAGQPMPQANTQGHMMASPTGQAQQQPLDPRLMALLQQWGGQGGTQAPMNYPSGFSPELAAQAAQFQQGNGGNFPGGNQ